MIRSFQKIWQDFLAHLDDPEVNIRERMFLILSVVALEGLFLATMGGVLIGENPISILFTAAGFFIFAVIVFAGFKLRKLRQASVLVSALLIFGFLPGTFYSSGGVYGGTPIWCVFLALYISMILEGKVRTFFYCAEAAVVLICWYSQYVNPQIVLRHTRNAIFSDSLGSLLIVSVVVTILVGFQAGLYQKETEKSEQQKKKIEELNASQNRFFSSMSHEIRTPINTIIGLNEMILRENASEEINEDAENIKAASTMLLHLINDILDVSKLESGQMKLDIRTYQTGAMLSDIVGMFWLRAQEKGLAFHVDIAPEIPAELSGDAIRIQQILINVINNAIKYTEVGSVTLSVQMEKLDGNLAKIIYTVSDTGRGIRKESIPYLFDAFTRIDEHGNRYIEGTGLGLSIVKQFVDLMGGTIAVNSIYTKGTSFIITIPQRVIDGSAMGEIHIERRRDPARRDVYQKTFEAPDAKVLVVDDTEASLMVVEKLLRETKVQITTAASGEEALRATLDTEFHVIFMDHMMPQMDGIECRRRIRSQTGGMCRDARIVALTANAGAENAALYEKEGFDGYLVKPISGDVLEKELRRLLPRELVTFTGTVKSIAEESMEWRTEHKKKSLVAVTTESVADLPPEARKEYGIGVIPYRVATSTGIFKDGEDLLTLGTLAYIEDGGEAQSMAPKAADYERFFANQLESANNVVHFALSSKVRRSGYAAAQEAAKSFDNVFVIDSGLVSGGLGMLAMEAARLVGGGRGPAYLKDWAERMRGRVHTNFVVDNIDYLISQYQFDPVFAKLLKAFLLHPVVGMKDGELVIQRLNMGTLHHAEKKYIAKTLSMPAAIDKRLLVIVYVGLELDELEWIRGQVEKRVKFEKVIFQCATSAIAVNCGPGAFGLLFWSI